MKGSPVRVRASALLDLQDDNQRTPDELTLGESSSTIRRRLADGTAYQAVKVPQDPEQLEKRLARLGWQITVTPTSGPFFWGACSRSRAPQT
jgi:hypothetical protein